MSMVEVAKVNDIPSGLMKSFPIEGNEILICNIDGNFYAINNTCTHAGGYLSKGNLEGKIVTCPRHGAKFDVTSGECISGPKMGIFKTKGKNIHTYQVIIIDNGIKVDIQ